jgi:hypothetical protein
MSLGDELLDRETHKPPHCDPVEFGADLDQFPTAREIVGIGDLRTQAKSSPETVTVHLNPLCSYAVTCGYLSRHGSRPSNGALVEEC